MIVVTGGAGFIGSALIWQLNQAEIDDILVVDTLGEADKWQNLRKRQFVDVVSIEDFLKMLEKTTSKIDFVFHMGACSSTTEKNADFLLENNTHYTMKLFHYCAQRNKPFVYASSAATYGLGEHGYSDDLDTIAKLHPINKYAFSKQMFDAWLLRQKKKPPLWAGLKFFNVYGPQEYHKGPQASVIYHAFKQIRDVGKLKLFKSYKEGVADGEQKRDFVYVKDAVKVMHRIYNNRTKKQKSGIYNVGSGAARSFVDLGTSVFSSMDIASPKFDWIPMPPEIKSQYQYFTEAELNNLRKGLGYRDEFHTLEQGVDDYVRNYLAKEDPYL